MDLAAELQGFVDRVAGLSHIRSLLSKEMMLIKFECNQQSAYISFEQSQCRLKELHNPSTHLKIRGRCNAITELINGKTPLQKLIKEKQLDVQASYRNILLLESIFILSNKRIETGLEI